MIILLGGTSEGRQVAKELLKRGYTVTLAVVSEHAASLARKDLSDWSPNLEEGAHIPALRGEAAKSDGARRTDGQLQIRVGPLDEPKLRALLEGAAALVDATHPFATRISSLAWAVCSSLGVPYLKIDRPNLSLPPEAVLVPDAETAARRCVREGGTGTIFLTVGVRTLPVYVEAARAAGRRVVARVLPTIESLAACFTAGLAPEDIVALHGPPDLETDCALLRRFGATVMVMKESGITGGIQHKLAACRQVGVMPIVVARPRPSSDENVGRVRVEDLPLALEQLGVTPGSARVGLEASPARQCPKSGGQSRAFGPKTRAGRVLMVVGTGSHVGKTLLVAALCRLYAKRGLRVAPFKAQNMALNSYVTPEGGEIGRAQAFQAEAAGVEPHVDMNPILLKPSSPTGSQVVLLGRPLANMQVKEYHAFQPVAWSHVTRALDRLRADYELVVIEGAGGVAEINLRDRDIVNMRVAKYCNAPTLLVGDIDRGGVFASLYGSIQLLEADEQALIRGFIINKFRGDPSLLQSGLSFLETSTGVPVLGVVPYLVDWRGDQEDSLGLESQGQVREWPASSQLRVAVVRLPFISNYTDFDALQAERDVCLRYISSPADLVGAHLVIVPGTKSTVADLAWLWERGLADAILKMAAQGVPVVGICGGYQMLGRVIRDPLQIESEHPEAKGLGLLDIVTSFAPTKETKRVQGELLGTALGPAGTPLRGYEIHMGATTLLEGARPLLRIWDSSGISHLDGAVSSSGTVLGTYVHGLFDDSALRRAALAWARHLAGLPEASSDDGKSDGTGQEAPSWPDAALRQQTLDQLCEHVARHVDIGRIDLLIGVS